MSTTSRARATSERRRIRHQRLIIVGLGPGGTEHLTQAAIGALSRADEVWLRTARHPGAEALPTPGIVRSFDDLYARLDSFAAVYDAIVAEVWRLAERPSGVVYAVPGHPLVGEATARALVQRARASGFPFEIVHGVSFLEPACAMLDLDPIDVNLQLIDAAALVAQGADAFPNLNPEPFAPTRPLLLCQLYDRRQASWVKLALAERFPDDHPLTLIRWAGVAGRETASTFPLFELDRRADIDHLACLYVPALAPIDDHGSVNGLRHIVARLRAPGGCPWDQQQTNQTLKKHLLEETHEAVAALDDNDLSAFAEELGDLLMLIVMQAQIAAEAGEFTLSDVCQSINAKLIRRHPHVFGDVVVAGADDVLRNWEQIKRREKAGEAGPASLLGKLPASLPALALAQEQQKRAATAGFVWPDPAAARAKLAEELAELDAATPEERRHELGDVLAAVAALAGQWRLDPEEALRLANHRFRDRFQRVEALAVERGVELASLTLAEKLALWTAAKAGASRSD